MDKLNPDALAEWDDEMGAPDNEVRTGVQRDTTPEMIADYVIAEGELPEQSARPFGEYLHISWNDYVEYEEITQRDLIAGALEFWRGKA
ncbi:hypothetical protein Q3A86_33215 [Streptomyces sp. NBUA17]|uniref:hypothetical protein n=1 Tax=Streptomyces sp. NBUA17 TaxID=3062275 RepID=UPI0037D9AC27